MPSHPAVHRPRQGKHRPRAKNRSQRPPEAAGGAQQLGDGRRPGGLDPLAAPSQQIWGYETNWGSFAQFTKVQAQQLLPKPPHLSWMDASSYGLTYFTAYRMLVDQAKVKAGDKLLLMQSSKGGAGLGMVASTPKGEPVIPSMILSMVKLD